MADDIVLPGTAAVVATDDIGSGRQVQLVKPAFGADGSATMVSGSNPLPVGPPAYQQWSGSVTGTGTLVGSFDVSGGYTAIIITVTGTFSGTTVLQGSFDGTNWTTVSLSAMGASTAGVASNGDFTQSSTPNGSNGYYVPVWFRYYQFVCTAYTSGTRTYQVALTAAPLHAMRVNVANSSLSVSSSATGTTTLSDAQANTPWSTVGSLGLGFNGATWSRQRLANIFKSVTATASGDTAVWTPTSGKRWQLLRFQLFATADAAQSSGGVITVTLRDVTTSTGLAIPVYVPATGGTALGGWSSGWIDVGPYGVRAAAINTNLNVNLSAALTAGAIGVVAAGTEE
ncbi:hypothetical protein FHR83_006704 [Actinoplanes campanulatus]|uniref:Uncharacterized protein n=1 Tax=Actinoplanes campanulatus TaxID=113559 RepID=A0A7W5AMG9_9ACTN|nr:hypothetical protein [Actinoplanes campanulatus]MBB3098998.1 hypothetical protein [Actinoplanes campanulatus]GGN39512.1 hypothetical protein GCM10010109_67520 [Actinoplanes campanulatus]GID40158.1 hypothetical protein Aca09nite_66640 [Actinoplanes campanulatus]